MKKIRQESREKEAEIGKLKESRDQLTVTIEELRETSRQQETTVSQLQKQISGGIILFFFFFFDLLPSFFSHGGCSSSICESVLSRQDC